MWWNLPVPALDADGKLAGLYCALNKSRLLLPTQLAEFAKVYSLRRVEVEGKSDVRAMLFAHGIEGLEGVGVIVVAGATGSGKTSLIQILAGGMETDPKLESDTKCPTLYILDLEGTQVAILDTAGLCDTAAEANKAPEMQQLLVNAVAATVQRFKLVVVSFLMCIDMGGRLPGNFYQVWPQMQMSLGGEALSPFCRFVVTKANADSKVAKVKLAKLPETDFYNALKYSSLGWKVISAGHENLEEIKSVLELMRDACPGIPWERMNASTECLLVLKARFQRWSNHEDDGYRALLGKIREMEEIGQPFRALSSGSHREAAVCALFAAPVGGKCAYVFSDQLL